MRILSAVCIALLLTVTLAGQSPEIRAHIDAYVAALSSGSPEQFDAMAKTHFTPDLLARTASQRAAMVARVHADFGAMQIARAAATSATHVDVEMHSATNSMPLTIAMDFEPQAPYRIMQASLRAGGPAAGPGGRGGASEPPLAAPPIAATMSASELSTALDSYLDRLAGAGTFAGVVLVSKVGEPVFQKAYGIANREQNSRMSPALRFNYASIGKAFTKTAIGQLISAGKLKLTDTIGAVLPDYPNADAKPATIDQLLNFRVGIADFFGEAFAAADKARFQSNHDYYLFVAPRPLTFAPGARTEYCNGCYVVLGEIIAKVSGVPYERYVQDHVFTLAGMTSAGFLAYGDPDVAPPYTRRAPDAPWTSAIGMHGHHGSAAGGAFGTVRDLLAFDTAIRTHVLLDAKTTAWFFDNAADETRPRALDPYGIAGGAQGANASLESDGTWAVITLGNLDPPNAVRVGTAIAGALGGGRSSVQAQPSEKDAVLATVNELFDGMRTRDRALLLSAFDESARLVRIRDQSGTPAVTSLPMDRFADSVIAAKAGDVWDERLRDPEVRIDGPLAQVWSFYTFRLNGSITSCGTDAFTLLKVGATWKITQVADTQRRENCDR